MVDTHRPTDPKLSRPLVDEGCFELAKHFLPNGTEDQLWSLADDIQRAVEDWFDLPENTHAE